MIAVALPLLGLALNLQAAQQVPVRADARPSTPYTVPPPTDTSAHAVRAPLRL